MKGKKRVHAFKNRMEHWQVVSIGLTVYDAIAMILAFLWHYGSGLIAVIR